MWMSEKRRHERATKQSAGDAQTLVESRVAPGTPDVSTDSRGAMDGDSQDRRMDVYFGGDIDESLQRERIRKRMFGEARPVMLGSLEVRERLGEGGMADVYAAYDPQLRRTVAIKILRPVDGGAALNLRERLLREAQAMADIDHVNVVKVHNVEIKNEPPYVVMEYFPEGSLRRWQRHEHGLREVLDVYMQAGAGLAELHRAKLVHRDFKPDNIFRKQDGRVAVGDLGLVSMEPAGSSESGSVEASGDDAGKLTAAGMILGTEAYMAPEQLRGEPADARSDQFCFCLALYEAACGTHPIAARGREQRRGAIERRELAAPARKVPGWLLGVLQRGLAPEPGERFASMDVLLGALERGRTRRRRMATAAVMLAGVAIVAAATVVLVQPSRDESCDPGRIAAEAFGDVWDGKRQREVKERLETAGAGGLWTVVNQTLDNRMSDWIEQHVEVCRGQRPAAERAVIDRCLRDTRREIWQKSRLLAEPSGTSAKYIAKANALAAEVKRMEDCSDSESLRIQTLPSPEQDQKPLEIEQRIEDAERLEFEGEYRQAERAAREAVRLAARNGYGGTLSQAKYRLGHVLGSQGKWQQAHEELRQAGEFAARVRRFRQSAESLLYQAKVALEDARDPKAGQEALAAARVMLIGAGELPTEDEAARDSWLHADYLETQGLLAHLEKDYPRAIELHTRSLHMRRNLTQQSLGVDHEAQVHAAPAMSVEISKSLNNVATSLVDSGDIEAGLALYRESREMRVAVCGEEHPLVADVDFNIANVYVYEKADCQAALADLQHVIAVERNAYGASLKLISGMALLDDCMAGTRESDDEQAHALLTEIGKIWMQLEAYERASVDSVPVRALFANWASQHGQNRVALAWLEEAAAILEGRPQDAEVYALLLAEIASLRNQ